MLGKHTDKQLVELLIKNNSEEAFCELYKRYYKKIRTFCLSFIKIEEAADDIVQDVFTTIWTCRNTLDSEMSFSSFIYTVVRNRTLNFLRQVSQDTKVKSELIRLGHAEKNTIVNNLIEKEYNEILDLAIAQLPPLRQSIYLLSRKDDKTHKEIAEQLKISPYTVQENISAALKHIKKYLSHHTDIEFVILLLFCTL